jgi:hypothetical protein
MQDQDFLILFLASFLAIPLARQSCFDAALFTGLQVVGVTLYFLDNILLLYLTLEPAKRVLERLAFLYANFSQKRSTSEPALKANPIILEFQCKLH